MGIYSNSVSFAQYRVKGELPAGEQFFAWLADSLQGRAFRSIEQTTDETAEGWTTTDNPDEPFFEGPADCWRDRYIFFSYRRDQRRIPAPLLRAHLGRAEGEELAKRPELKRLPKQLKEELTERVKLALFARSLPAPTTVDLLWHQDTGKLLLFSASSKVMERFEELFGKSFENLNCQLVYPFSRSISLLDQGQQELLRQLDQASTESALDQIENNSWLGEQFLLWLLHSGLQDGKQQVSVEGQYSLGEPFSAWIDDKMVLQGGGEEGLQKITVSGSQDSYLEARTAISNGKNICNATIYLEKDELQWRFNLNGQLFTFNSFKTPPVKIERDGNDQLSEREAVFYERVYLLETGLQMFDSLLLTFLRLRLGGGWEEELEKINLWLKEI